MAPSYLGELTIRLATGAMQLSQPLRRRQGEFLQTARRDDGGFGGRQGGSDLYYTGFAVRALALIGQLSQPSAGETADFLARHLEKELPSVDFLSLVYTAVLLEFRFGIDVFGRAGLDRAEVVGARLEPFRRDDGGYAKTKKSGPSSTYHTFLASACRELTGAGHRQPEAAVAMIRRRQRDDGGFVELDQLNRSGTNPTAAAVGLLRLLDAVDDTLRAGAVEFLLGMRTAEGGLRANNRIPLADLLSTFTGLVALADLDALDRIDPEPPRRYVHSLALPGGGFRGAAWDTEADVEYTFYGLGTLALLATAGR